VDTCAEKWFEGHAVKLAALVTSAILALVTGTLVYLLDREWGSTLFLAHFARWQAERTEVFGVLGGNLPSFFHSYAIAVLLIVLIGHTRYTRYTGAALWFAIAAALECLQAAPVKTFLDSFLPAPGNLAFLASIHAYIENGHFDTGDLLAAGSGCLVACAVSFFLEDIP
jgi:hypothetical protein